MSNTMTSQKSVVLWLRGAKVADIRNMPEVERLFERGAVVALAPAPITGLRSQYYQAFSGQLPEKFGFFDTLLPHSYGVVEELTGRGPAPRLLPDLLRTVGWTVRFEEARPGELAASVQEWASSVSASPACLIVACDAQTTDAQQIAEAVRLASEWVAEDGLLAIFSEAQTVAVEHLVNINNFLADMGVVERDEQSGQINWQNSLAYYVGHGQIWVNLLGRDGQGVVHPQDEYDEVCETLIKALPAKLLDKSGATVIERIYRKEELYTGDYLFCAPDLVVVFKPGYAPSPRSTRLDFDEETFTTPVSGATIDAGAHPSLLMGFLLAVGPGLASGIGPIASAPLTALVPTLLHALGLEYIDMDSPAISEVFSAFFLETHPIRSSAYSQELSEADEELIIGHLRDLGYV